MEPQHWLEIAIGVIITLMGWVLREIIAVKGLVRDYKWQIERIVSDIESEKGTRQRLHADFEQRLRYLERKTGFKFVRPDSN